ncbi:hypothetical protein EDEG_03508 [Edhazardia aedis USNM 41457]|uniref:SUI1 domain-containing protein n=1 Tax=Edhazardia aedis (strain USNM 41457) TaxID=1003232 RepID=J9DHI3_EDHAE|nr:hypothetical protein EDEG_03508 [Edhazardia aedis USNM 41457]|eukprot:EJW02045.1 hypothetical protein EDEG_03508 [Edhazardia aedis USNM 41457]
MSEVSPNEKTIQVLKAPSKGKKILTIIAGIPDSEQESLLKHLKNALGCGGNINKETMNLQLQGDVGLKVGQVLSKKMPEYKIVYSSKKL